MKKSATCHFYYPLNSFREIRLVKDVCEFQNQWFSYLTPVLDGPKQSLATPRDFHGLWSVVLFMSGVGNLFCRRAIFHLYCIAAGQ